MKIKSNAAPIELTSPFFEENKTFCSKFESYIASKNGKVKGKYNATSYLVFGKIPSPKTWELIYKKATYTSTGNLLLSSKRQNLLVMAKWETHFKGYNGTAFKIRRRKRLDVLRFLFSKRLSKLHNHSNYVISNKGDTPKFFKNLTSVLQPLFNSKELYKTDFVNEKLTIELRSKQQHFDIVDQLLKI
ncbi:MAG: hypothetical protein AAFX55_08570 [Bacteroidota bacterium]